MKLERKLEALTRIEWALKTIIDQDENHLDGESSEFEQWEIDYQREMEDAKALVDKMIEEAIFDIRVANLAVQYREHGYKYHESVSAARKQLKEMGK